MEIDLHLTAFAIVLIAIVWAIAYYFVAESKENRKRQKEPDHERLPELEPQYTWQQLVNEVPWAQIVGLLIIAVLAFAIFGWEAIVYLVPIMFYFLFKALWEDPSQPSITDQWREHKTAMREAQKALERSEKLLSELGGQHPYRGGSGRREPIPQSVRREVWRRDQGRCVICGSQANLEYDHIIPYSKGGSSTARNLQLLCQTCNRSKGASI